MGPENSASVSQRELISILPRPAPATSSPGLESAPFHRLFAREAAVAAYLEAIAWLGQSVDPDQDDGDDEAVIAQAGHTGDREHLVDSVTFRAISRTASKWFGDQDNFLLATEEGVLHLTPRRHNMPGIFADPLDGTTLFRLTGQMWASVVLVFIWSSRRNRWRFSALAIAGAHGWVQTVDRHRTVHYGRAEDPPENDRRVSKVRAKTVASICAVASGGGALTSKGLHRDLFHAVCENLEWEREPNVGGTPLGFGLCQLETAGEVKFKPSRPFDAAHLPVLLAMEGYVAELETREYLNFDRIVELMEENPFAEVIPAYAAGKDRGVVEEILGAWEKAVAN